MKPIRFEDANVNLVGYDVEDLPAYFDGKMFITRWHTSLRERLSILLFGNVWLGLLSAIHPPIAITGGCGANFCLPERPDAP